MRHWLTRGSQRDRAEVNRGEWPDTGPTSRAERVSDFLMVTPAEIATRVAPNALPEMRDPSLAVALSGGGYRAMLFHLGALRRLNEFGLLSVMDRLSCVSGGSIAGAALAMGWDEIGFDKSGVGAGGSLVPTR